MMVQSEVLSEPYVFGHVTECDDLSEDGGPLWQAEVQTLGGYGVAATVYAGTEEAARRMAEQAITAWNTRTTAVATDPTQFGDDVAAEMRAYFEAHKRDKWQEGTADNLMLGLSNIAMNAVEARKWDRFVVESWMPALLELKKAIQQHTLFPRPRRMQRGPAFIDCRGSGGAAGSGNLSVGKVRTPFGDVQYQRPSRHPRPRRNQRNGSSKGDN
jgi:hypothetical protein